MANYIAAIDQGTTSSRCMIFNHAGEPVSSHQLEHEQIYPKPGWVEHDAVEIWSRTEEVIRTAMKKVELSATDIAAIGVTNQRETTVVWDKKTGQPYYNAIVWQDTRTDRICNELMGDVGQDRLREKTGLPLATYFSGPKISWILDNVAGVRQAAERGDALFGTMDSWIIWKLTGVHVTDVTNASRTMLMDLESCDWDDEILELMNIPRQMLPSIRPSSDPEIYGETSTDGPFSGVIPVCGDLGDQQAATVGQTCFDIGEAKNTYGTGCFMLLNTGTEIVQSKNGLLTTPCYKFGNEPTVYALEGSIAIAGAVVQWLRDQLQLIEHAEEIEALAFSVEDNGGMYFVPAFSGLFAPYWKSNARGAIVGMTRYVTRGHFARAALEAVAYQTREILDAMEADSGVKLQALKVDGGMVANELLMQYQAHVLGVPVTRPKVAESTALGAAYAAGLAVEFWKNTAEMRQNWGIDKTWHPSEEDTARTANYRMWKKAVTRTFDWIE
ncbi:glycerol kinase [Malonomonas rubra DSM 5091]|uniref:Glycerol kinase n=1 Tax=Malonomonas rubra DSM 5091 TaxID=1122189 RepID=A0A1M6I3X4_MALRU|nr:glycerol kinase GlpK [Malonomonas rubra]SHJ29146.1 glycerol kinase [Malonomonas rubra DSM 5091]